MKRYYIGEVAKLTHISRGTLIRWSDDGVIPKAHRDETLLRKRYWLEDELTLINNYRQANYKY